MVGHLVIIGWKLLMKLVTREGVCLVKCFS
jgi:hypothetical protein